MHVYLDIKVRKKHNGYAYKGIAHVEGFAKPIIVEGWSAGKEKEVRKVVQERIQKIILDRQRIAARKASNEPETIQEKKSQSD